VSTLYGDVFGLFTDDSEQIINTIESVFFEYPARADADGGGFGDGAFCFVFDAAGVGDADDAHCAAQEFCAAVMSGVAQDAQDVAAAVFGEGFCTAVKIPVFGGDGFAIIIFCPESVKFGGKTYPDVVNGFGDIGLVAFSLGFVGGVPVMRKIVQDEILQDCADVVAHRTEESEFGVDNTGIFFVEHDRASVQIGVDEASA